MSGSEEYPSEKVNQPPSYKYPIFLAVKQREPELSPLNIVGGRSNHTMLTVLFVFVVYYQVSVANSHTCYPDWDAIENFTKSLTGYVIKPEDSRYQNASTMKDSLYTRHPGMIVMANSVQDVQKSVVFAKTYDLLVTVHSSGHDYNGRSTADGSLMIDLSSMKKISINLQSKRHEAGEVTVESGNSWLKIYEKVQSVDRVVVGGSSHTVSPGGYTLGGGHSPISRSFGLAADQVLEMKVVVADGRIIDCTADGSTVYHVDETVQKTTDKDLFWALRGGGGGTYGIVVTFTYKLHYQPSQLVKMVITVPMNVLPKPFLSGFIFLEAFNAFVQNLPNEYGGYLILDNFPPRTEGINQIGTYRLLVIKFGPWDKETENVLTPFEYCISQLGCELKIENKTSFYDYEKDMFDIPITRVYTLGTFLQPATLNIGWTTFILPELALLNRKNVFMICIGTLIGGKVSHFSNDSAPIHPGFRDGLVCMTCAVALLDPSKDEQNIAAGRLFSRSLQQYGNGVYVNEAAYDLDNWQDAFWGNHYNHLLEIKRKWDPTNLFTCHHCVGSEIETVRRQIVTCDGEEK